MEKMKLKMRDWKKDAASPSAAALGGREIKFSDADRLANACLMHFTEALNATYGIMLYSGSD